VTFFIFCLHVYSGLTYKQAAIYRGKKTTVYPLINGLFSVRVKNKTGSAVCQPQMRVKWQDGKNTNNKAKLLRVAAS